MMTTRRFLNRVRDRSGVRGLGRRRLQKGSGLDDNPRFLKPRVSKRQAFAVLGDGGSRRGADLMTTRAF